MPAHGPSDQPVVVGVSQVVNRPGPGFAERSATALMVEAGRRALAETGAADRLGALVDEVLVPHGTWPEADPGRVVARAIGAVGARSIRSELGIVQHALLRRAAGGVQAGHLRAALVVGAESRWSAAVAAKRGAAPPAAPEADEGEPDEVLAPDAWPIAQVEIDRNLTTPAHQYAILDAAQRHVLGVAADRRLADLGARWARMAEVAARSEVAWDRSGPSAAAIVEATPDNRLLAAPYRKRLVTQWTVDLSVALVVTSVGVARELGIPEDRWVHPLVTAVSDDVAPVCERAELHRWPAAAVTSRAAYDAAGVAAADLAAVDLYSCFPIAVEVQAREMGLDPDGPLTLTGGMTFAGGPYNSYSLHGAAAMVEHLRGGEPGAVGLTSAVSGFLTKSGVTLWSTTARSPFAALDVTAEAAAATERRPVDPDLTGAATVVGATVVPAPDDRLEVLAVLESDALVRTVAGCADQPAARRALVEDLVGGPAWLEAPGRFRLA